MKQILTLVLLFSAFTISAQNEFITITPSKNDGKVEGVFSLVSDQEKTFAIFLGHDDHTQGYLYQFGGTLVSQYSASGLPDKYNEIVGQTIKGNAVRLFLKNKNNKSFGSLLFDFDKGVTTQMEFDFKLKGERYLQCFSKNDRFYVLTIIEKTSHLKIYAFNHKAEVIQKKIPVDSRIFRNSENKPVSLYKLMTQRVHTTDDFEIPVVYTNLPNTIYTSSKLLKMYPNQKGFRITIDKGLAATYLIDVDITKLSAQVKGFLSPRLTKLTAYSKSNSYLLGDELFQIIGNEKEVVFSSQNVVTKERRQQQHYFAKEEILTKNSPFYIVTGARSNQTLLDAKYAKAFVRATGLYRIGLVASPMGDSQYQVELGAYHTDYYTSGYTFIAPGIGGFVGGLLVGTVQVVVNATINPAGATFGVYDKNPITRIECLFDHNLNHIKGPVTRNIFDKIKLEIPKGKKIKYQNLFKIEDAYLYGYYNREDQQYRLLKFFE